MRPLGAQHEAPAWPNIARKGPTCPLVYASNMSYSTQTPPNPPPHPQPSPHPCPGELRCKPNSKNVRDLEIEIAYHFKGKKGEWSGTQQYKMR
jgi:hypothetical protein